MSLQRHLIDFVLYYYMRSQMARGVNLAKLRSDNRPEPPAMFTYGCQYETCDLSGVRAIYVRPKNLKSVEVLVYLHGGAYVAGMILAHWALLSRLCHETGRLGVMVDYRLAPEHPFPAALDDAVAVLAELAKQHGAENLLTKNLLVLGDSAGGGLAVASAMKLRDQGHDLPGKLVLLSPWLDITLDHSEIPALEGKDRVLARFGLVEAGQWYANGHDPKSPYLSPVVGDFSGLPPVLLLVGTHEMLLPDCRVFKAKAEAQGVALQYHEYPQLFHDWPLMYLMLPEAEQAVREVIGFIVS